MKPLDEDFNALYNAHDLTPEQGNGDVDPLITYRNVLRKAGLSPRRQKRFPKALMIAALLGTAALTAAAAVYTVSDAFRGALQIHGSAAGSSAAGPVVDRTGQLIGETQKSGSVELSLRAAVGDQRTLKVLVDVKDGSGKSLVIRQPDGTDSKGSFALETYTITKADGQPLSGSSNYSFVNFDPENGKFSILFDYAVTEDIPNGETLQLHFEDILQSASLDGTPLDMGPDDLHNIVSAFGPYSDSDFRLSSSTNGKNFYLLNVQSSQIHRPLAKDFPGIQIIGAAVKDGALYLQGTAESPSQLDKVLDNVVLRGKGGDVCAADMSRSDDGGWSLRFDGFDSPDALKGYVWRYGAEESFHTAYAGAWDFTFKASFEDLAVKLTPNLNTTWEGNKVTVTRLELSPYSLFLQYSTDRDTALRMFPPTDWGAMQTSDWIESPRAVTLTMKDGAVIKSDGGSLAPKGGNLAMVPAGTVITEYETQYNLDTVIDPSQVASVKIGDQVISLSR